MTRIPLDNLTSDQLDQLYAERDRYFHFACAARGASGARDFPDLTDTILALRDRAERAEADRERVQQAACRTAGTLRHAEGRVAELEKLHEAHLRVEQRLAREQLAAKAVIERVRKLAIRWVKRTDQLKRAAELLADALDQPQQPTGPAAAVEVREPCPYCADHQMIPRRQYAEHVARLHPAEQQPPA